MEMIPIIDSSSLKIIDFKERLTVRQENLWHFSSLILPIQEKTGKLLLQTRPRGKTFEGKLDIFGGFINQNSISNELKERFNKSTLEKLFLDAAIRESNEEIVIWKNNRRINITQNDLYLLFPFTGFIANNEINREISSIYMLIIPFNSTVETYDDIKGDIINVDSEFYEFETIQRMFMENTDQFADSLYRLIDIYFGNSRTKNELNKMIGYCKNK